MKIAIVLGFLIYTLCGCVITYCVYTSGNAFGIVAGVLLVGLGIMGIVSEGI